MATSPDFQLFSSLRYDPRLLTCPSNTAITGFPSPFYMLLFHRDRMLSAATHFGWSTAASRLSGPTGLSYLLQTINAAFDTTDNQPRRIRTVLDHEGNLLIEATPTPPKPLRDLFPSRLPPPGPAEDVKVSPLTGGVLELGPDDSLSRGPGCGDPVRAEPYTILVDTERTEPSPFTTYKTTQRNMYVTARQRVGIETFAEPKEVLIVSTGSEVMEGSVTSVYFWRRGRWVTPPVESGGQAGTTRRWLLEMGLCVEEVVDVASLVDGEECWISNGVRGVNYGIVKLR
jgi:4-amino-4-deoxychorismate lyase